MQHAGAVSIPKHIEQSHIAVQEGDREESTSFGGRGWKGGNLKGIQCLWAHPRYDTVFQVPRESFIGAGWWLAGGDSESGKGTSGLEENDHPAPYHVENRLTTR